MEGGGMVGTLIASISVGGVTDPVWELTPAGETAVASALERMMTELYGGLWYAVPGGEKSEDWGGKLRAGLRVPSADQVAVAEYLMTLLLARTFPGYWQLKDGPSLTLAD